MNAMEDNSVGEVIPINERAEGEQQGDSEAEGLVELEQAFEGGKLEGAAGVAAKFWGLGKNWFKPKVGGADVEENVRKLDAFPGNNIWRSHWI
jgi:hypothetical protein